eukprot:10877485-Alexandrium_andersonii.AAC.1
MLGGERLLCQGVPCWAGELGLDVEAPFPAGEFSESSLRSVAGNAIHSGFAGALFAFALASMEKAHGRVPVAP